TNETVWTESFFKDSNFVLARGLLKIVDYQSIMTTMQNLPSLLDTVGKITSTPQETNPQPTYRHPSKTKGDARRTVIPQTTNPEIQQLKNQMKTLPLKDVANFVDQM